MVVACVAGDCHNGVTAGWKLFEVEELHAFCADERLLGIIEDMSHRVHSQRVVRSIDTHCLFTHGRLVSISGRLVVIWVWNDRRTHSQNHRRMYLTMRVAVLSLIPQVSQVHRNHRCLFLINVQELNQALLQCVAKVHALLGLKTLDVTFSED